MILLDTNVMSELIKPQPDPAVAAFLAVQPLEILFVPSLVVAEIRYGIRRCPPGRRRDKLVRDFEAFLDAGFGTRILAFDASCAVGYATVRASREEAGRRVQIMDTLIGGMALAHGATLVTRNVRDFDGYGLTLINPWESL